ncbi:MAG: LPS-assembly protein LptD [Spirochaetota bacterium]|nr:MAG: LPS-assembly protein LptD [Spirochaetota bacterium]
MSRIRWVLLYLLLVPWICFAVEESDRSVYEIVKDGIEEELRQEARKRGISDDGDVNDLRRRLLDHELGKQLVPFEERAEAEKEDGIILQRADFIEHRETEGDEEIIYLRGNVDITYRDKRIYADEMRINVDQGFIAGKGNITFIDDSGKEYLAEEFFYDTNTDEGVFFQGKSTLKKFIYSGNIIRKIHESEKFVSENATITTCNIKYPHYRVEANRLFYYDPDYVLIKDASFYFGQDALIELPYYYSNLEEPDIKTSLHFRERAGLVIQNTYYPVKSDETQLALKGDVYERLGVYTGADFFTDYSVGETDLKASAVLANEVYYYDAVTENWSPWGPPGSTDYTVNRYFRYNLGGYQKFEYGDRTDNTTELNLYWTSDPYYEYDFERRSETFDLFKLIEQAESDNPRKDSGFSWYANHYTSIDSFDFSVLNNMTFKPQRNTAVDTVYLPGYYEHRLYTITAPNVTISHHDTILHDIQPEFISSLDYVSSANYQHTAYYDDAGMLYSEVHRASTWLNLGRSYELAEYIEFTPEIEVGAEGQSHVEPTTNELQDDQRRTLLYGETKESLIFGPDEINLELYHNLKYKLAGPDDFYDYGRFRIHKLGIAGYAEFWKFTEELTTSYDLRPTYDWSSGTYNPDVLDQSRFSPLINTLTFRPIETLSLSDRFIYDIANSRPKTNSFILNYYNDNIYLDKHRFTLDWNLDWEHNFNDPLRDILHSNFEVNMDIYRYLTLYFSVYSRNEDIWRYFPSLAQGQGVETVNPIVDLLKSFNFLNVEDRKDSYFKLKSISFGLTRDLHDWQLNFDYTGNREISYDGTRYLWNNTFSISIGLKEVEDVNIHTTFTEGR